MTAKSSEAAPTTAAYLVCAAWTHSRECAQRLAIPHRCGSTWRPFVARGTMRRSRSAKVVSKSTRRSSRKSRTACWCQRSRSSRMRAEHCLQRRVCQRMRMQPIFFCEQVQEACLSRRSGWWWRSLFPALCTPIVSHTKSRTPLEDRPLPRRGDRVYPASARGWWVSVHPSLVARAFCVPESLLSTDTRLF